MSQREKRGFNQRLNVSENALCVASLFKEWEPAFLFGFGCTPLLSSLSDGVRHPTSRNSSPFPVSAWPPDRPRPVNSLAETVGPRAATTCWERAIPVSHGRGGLLPLEWSRAVGDTPPPKPLPHVWRADARSAQIGTPDSISHSLQVRTYSGEPFTSSRARNLLAKDCCRSALGDKPPKSGPQVALIVNAFPLSSGTEWLARARSRPDWSVFRPSSQSQCVRPAANACEKVTLRESGKLVWPHVSDVSFIYFAPWYQVLGYQLSKPCRSASIDLIVIDGHSPSPARFSPAKLQGHQSSALRALDAYALARRPNLKRQEDVATRAQRSFGAPQWLCGLGLRHVTRPLLACTASSPYRCACRAGA